MKSLIPGPSESIWERFTISEEGKTIIKPP